MKEKQTIDQDGFYKMVGGRIKHLRQAKNLSQEAFALEIGLTDRAVIARWEAGTRRIPLHCLVDISNALDEDIGYLLGRGKVDRIEDFRNDKRKRSDEPVLQDPNSPYVLHMLTPDLISKMIPGAATSDPRNLLLDRFLAFLQSEAAFAHIYTSAEIQEAVEDHFGVTVDLQTLSDFMGVFNDPINEERNNRARALVSLIENELKKMVIRERFRDDIEAGIASRIEDLKQFLYDCGYTVGQSDAEEEKQDQNAQYEEYKNQFEFDYELDFASDYEDGKSKGYSDELRDITGPQDWDDI